MHISVSSGRGIVVRRFACLVAIALIGLPLIYRSSASTHSAKIRPNAVAAGTGKIAFASDRDGNLEIYLMDTDGGGQTRLTENPGEDYSPAWSPDGKRLAFVSTRDGNAEIYVMNADGTNQTRLTSNTASDLHPAWAPNGTQIAFVTNRDGNDEIYLMNPDGSNQVNLTNNPFDDDAPAYSPDGSLIFFSSKRQDAQFNIYRMNADGSGVIRLTTTAADDVDPSASNGKIIFQSNRDDNDELYSMTFTGSPQTRITTNTELDEDPSQTANGDTVVFSSTRDGNLEIYALNLTTNALARLTTNSVSDVQPALQPAATVPAPPAAGATTVQFSATDYTANESDAVAVFTVTRSGSTSGTSTVDFATNNGTATLVGDYTPNFGSVKFNAGETSKTFSVLLTEDAYEEGNETLTVTLSNPTGAALGTLNTATLTILENDTTNGLNVNPIDNARFFVTQHYADFLSRLPDPGGLDYWTNQITQCGNNQTCLRLRRNGVSGAFFAEMEFQDTGFFVTRLYKGSFGAQPTSQQFIRDRARVVGGTTLAADKLALATDFVSRDAFLARYPLSQTPEEFVNKLFDTALLTPFTAERTKLAQDIRNGKSRAQALIDVIEISQFKSREFNTAFVLMQYFGYLRRDIDVDGFNFWLDVINNRDPNNYAGMICAFITSTEYQLRFSSTVTASNAQCAGVR